MLIGVVLADTTGSVDFPGPLVVGLDTTTVSISPVTGLPGSERLLVAGTADGFLALTQFRPAVGKVGVLTRYFAGGTPVAMVPDPVPMADAGIVAALADPDRLAFFSVEMSAPYFQEIQSIDVAEDPGAVCPLALGTAGEPGLAVSLPGMDRILILGREGLSWAVFQDLPVGDRPGALAAGDLDGDGLAELYVSQSGYLSQDVGILTQSGQGVFSLAGSLDPGLVPGPLAVFDAEGDGSSELFLAGREEPTVLILEGQGGELVEHDRTDLSLPADSLRLMRLPDGTAVMVAAGTDRGLVDFLAYDQGRWSRTGSYYPACRPRDCLPLDFSGDGYLDLACPGDAPGYTVMFGAQDPRFWGFSALVLHGEPRALTLADIDGGGSLAAVIVDRVSPVLDVFTGLSGGAEPAGARLDSLDFLPGLVAALPAAGPGGQPVAVTDPQGGRIVVLDLAQAGQVRLLSEVPVDGEPAGLKTGDIDGDGHGDLVYILPGLRRAEILFGDGSGGFPDRTSVSTAFIPVAVEFLDLNGDGLQELVLDNGFYLRYLRNTTGRDFGSSVRIDTEGGASFMATGDLDGDLDRDLVVYSKGEQSLTMLENDGQGRLVPRLVNQALDNQVESLHLEDVTSDGRADILLNLRQAGEIGLVLVGQEWEYEVTLTFPSGRDVAAFACADFDGDGAGDILALDASLELGLIMINGSFSLVAVAPEALETTCTAAGPRLMVNPDRPGSWLLEQDRGAGWQPLAGPGWTVSGTITYDRGTWLLDPGRDFAGPAGGAGDGILMRLRLTLGSGSARETLVRDWIDPCAKDEAVSLPARLTWTERPWPNPFNPALNWRVEVDRASRLEAGVYDLRGRLVRRIFQGPVPAGGMTLRWDGNGADGSAASGVYFIRLATVSDVLTAKVILAR